ncbi:MAG: molybdenum ABC transporter ATP-binding protein, partial [Hyphomicrobiales bacterium]
MSDKTLTLSARLTLEPFEIDVDDDIALDGITALFGPSGVGKTTLWRIIAGLEKNAKGRVAFCGKLWADSNTGHFLAPHLRPIGMVFQDARLFPHLDVAGNLRFGSKRGRQGGAISYDQVMEALDLKSLLERKTEKLSGGERQRVAIGRTLLAQPQLLLLDEPLSALDIRRKGELLPFIELIPRQFGVPAIYVSHAIDEVARIAGDVIMLANGKIAARGPVPEIFQQLDTHGVTGHFEAGVVIEAVVTGHDEAFQLTQLQFEGEEIQMPMVASLEKDDRIRLRVRAGDVSLATTRPGAISMRNALSGEVVEIEPEVETAFAEVLVRVGKQNLRARITRQSVSELGLSKSVKVYVLIKGISFDRRILMSPLDQPEKPQPRMASPLGS